MPTRYIVYYLYHVHVSLSKNSFVTFILVAYIRQLLFIYLFIFPSLLYWGNQRIKRDRNGKEFVEVKIGKRGKEILTNRFERGEKKKNEWTTAVQQRERSGKGEEKGRPLKEMNDSMLIKLTRSHCGQSNKDLQWKQRHRDFSVGGSLSVVIFDTPQWCNHASKILTFTFPYCVRSFVENAAIPLLIRTTCSSLFFQPFFPTPSPLYSPDPSSSPLFSTLQASFVRENEIFPTLHIRYSSIYCIYN